MTQTLLFADPEKPQTRGGMIPRNYQIAAHDETLRLWDSGVLGVLLRLATGTGKTLTASLIADTWLRRGPDYRVLIVSYETQLVTQFAQEIEDYIGIVPGIEMDTSAQDAADMPRVIVASRQSLLRAVPPTPAQMAELAARGIADIGAVPKRTVETYLKYLRKAGDVEEILEDIKTRNASPEADGSAWSRLHKFDWRFNWMVVFDEGHRHAYHLASVGHLVDWFERNPAHRRLGMTATPKRGDEVSIGDRMFPGIALDFPLYSGSKACAVKEGWAVPYLQKYIEVEGVDFANPKFLKRESESGFDDGALSAELEKHLASFVTPMLDMVGTRKTLIFSPGVQMAKDVAVFINARSPARCECGLERWYPKAIIGDGAACICGRFIGAEKVTRPGDLARELDGSSPPGERKETYAWHQTGQGQFLSVCGLCIAKGTLILTDRGEIPIERVTPQMLLWDGVEWVTHDGVVFKGKKNVIEYAGITATENHNVWTDYGWMRLAACKQQRIAIRISGIGREAIRESCNYYRNDHSTWQEPASRFRGSLLHVRSDKREGVQRDETRECWLPALRQEQRRSQLVADAVPVGKKTVRKSERHVLFGLWRTRNQVSVSFASSNGSVGHGEVRTTQGTDSGPQGQQFALRTGKHSLGQPDGTGEQQTATATRIQETVEVYDILNAGPRYRFTANGLIVSNCREGYNDPDISCVACFRPVSKEASALAEQMKGRSCRVLRSLARLLHQLPDAAARCKAIAESAKPNALIIDLSGITGLADCASTIEIYADGLPDEVKEKAKEILVEAGIEGETNIEEVIERAKAEVEADKERVRLEREAAEQAAREEFERRSKADARAKYTTHDVGFGASEDPLAATDKQYRFAAFLGLEVNCLRPKKQLGRIIHQLQQRLPLEEIVRTNRLGEDDWQTRSPSVKQLGFAKWKGVPAERAKTPYDCSLLIDAKLEPAKFERERMEAIGKAQDAADLTGVAKDIGLVNGVLPAVIYARLVEAGKNKRHFLDHHDDPLPE